MKRMKNIRLGTLVACMCVLWGCEKPNVNIVMPQEASNRVLFAGEHLKKALEDAGYSSVMLSDTAGMDKDEVCIRLEQAADTAGLKKEGFTISTRGNMTTVTRKRRKRCDLRLSGIDRSCRAIQGFEVSGTTDGCSGNGASRRLCRDSENGIPARKRGV